MMHVVDLKRVILAMVHRPFVLKTTKGQQVSN